MVLTRFRCMLIITFALFCNYILFIENKDGYTKYNPTYLLLTNPLWPNRNLKTESGSKRSRYSCNIYGLMSVRRVTLIWYIHMMKCYQFRFMGGVLDFIKVETTIIYSTEEIYRLISLVILRLIEIRPLINVTASVQWINMTVNCLHQLCVYNLNFHNLQLLRTFIHISN